MSKDAGGENGGLPRQEISDAVTGLGWRYIRSIVQMLQTCVRVKSLAEAVAVADRVVTKVGPEAHEFLRADIRNDRVVLTLQAPTGPDVTRREVDFAQPISAIVHELGLTTDAETDAEDKRSAQVLEIAIDAMDIDAVRPFWKAVLGYVDEPGSSGPESPLVDPFGQYPAIWFQQMAAPRPQRNRIHLDISVPHDEGRGRVQDALAAGGTLVSEAKAPAFWVLADVEGNEACVTTWQDPND